MTGTVARWDDDRGYGFVQTDERPKRRAFLHISDVAGRPPVGSLERPRVGDLIEAEDLATTDRGLRAVGVRVVKRLDL